MSAPVDGSRAIRIRLLAALVALAAGAVAVVVAILVIHTVLG
jgi:hypothetical protein